MVNHYYLYDFFTSIFIHVSLLAFLFQIYSGSQSTAITKGECLSKDGIKINESIQMKKRNISLELIMILMIIITIMIMTGIN